MTATGTNLLGLVKHLAGLEYGYLGVPRPGSNRGRHVRHRQPGPGSIRRITVARPRSPGRHAPGCQPPAPCLARPK
ncbi:MAG TPA: hypothetical protein VME44_16645 [Streptosporangiaceae bacterium]|nr:hypothetical protein [Streptosporangiaceae bacterium]